MSSLCKKKIIAFSAICNFEIIKSCTYSERNRKSILKIISFCEGISHEQKIIAFSRTRIFKRNRANKPRSETINVI